jgi:RHS repeat-associated protein
MNRLNSASETGAASWQQNYGYDRFGNRWYSSGNYLPNPTLTPQSVAAYGDQSKNQLIASIYDNAGNQTTDAATSGFTYDAENRQISSTVGGTYVTYNYDGDGRRVKKVVGTSTTIFVYNAGGQLIAEYTSPDTISNNGLSYLTSDHLGSTRVVTDINGFVKSRHDYLPFGEEIGTDHLPTGLSYGATDGERQKFTGKERDSESGLDYFVARYYSSAQGRFTSPDEFTGGPEDLFDFADNVSANPTFYADLTNPQSLNKYQYSYNNPLRYVDPNGHDPGDDEPKGTGRQIVDTAADVAVGVLRGFASSVTGGLIGAPKETDSIASRLGQAGGSGLAIVAGTDVAVVSGTGGIVTSPTVVGAVAGGVGVAAGVGIVSGGLVNAARVVTTPIHQKGGPSGENSPGVSSSGHPTDQHGNKLGPSGKPMVNTTRSTTREAARNRALREGSRTVEHRNPKRGEGHFHPADFAGKKKPVSTHHEY